MLNELFKEKYRPAISNSPEQNEKSLGTAKYNIDFS